MSRTPWELTEQMFLNEGEVEQLLSAVRRPAGEGGAGLSARTDRLIVECLLFSGLRSTEFCRLRLADTVLGHGRSAFVVQGRRGRRTVFVPESVSVLVREYAEQVRPRLAGGRRADDPNRPLVLSERGEPYERSGLYRRVVRILTSAGLGERASVQLLRHTYGYLAYLRTGGNLLFVQRQLDHAHPMVTVVYAKFVREDYGELADLVGAEGPPPAGRPTAPTRIVNRKGARTCRRAMKS